MKLLLIRIVASNFLGLALSFNTTWSSLSPSFSRLSRSFGDNEKKATSEPETKAELHNNMINPKAQDTMPQKENKNATELNKYNRRGVQGPKPKV